jgi:hypothetical protein
MPTHTKKTVKGPKKGKPRKEDGFMMTLTTIGQGQPMVVIKFPDRPTQDEAVGFLACHFSGRLFRSGEVIVPAAALGALAAENFTFTVLGRARDDQMAPLRSTAASSVQ